MSAEALLSDSHTTAESWREAKTSELDGEGPPVEIVSWFAEPLTAPHPDSTLADSRL